MDTRLSKAALLVFILSSIENGYGASVSVGISTKLSTTNAKKVDKTTTKATATGATGCREYYENADGDIVEEYVGNQSWTFTKKICQRWDSQFPHSHTYTDPDWFDGAIENISQAENYCQNLDVKSGGPWCFTTDVNKRWEYCDVPFCYGCRNTTAGSEYTGTRNTVMHKEGDETCVRWDDLPNSGLEPADFPGGITNISQAENYCRQPFSDSAHGPYCYVTMPYGLRMRVCQIMFCQGCQTGEYYDGIKSTTKSGQTCLRWDSLSPEIHNITGPTMFKVSSEYNLTHVNEAENYCRTTVDDQEDDKPWCYTTDSDNGTSWKECDVPQCLNESVSTEQ